MGVYLGSKLLGSGKGKNKQEAAQSAASDALKKVKATKVAT
jgi:dsRNA-specific ribonuclease